MPWTDWYDVGEHDVDIADVMDGESSSLWQSRALFVMLGRTVFFTPVAWPGQDADARACVIAHASRWHGGQQGSWDDSPCAAIGDPFTASGVFFPESYVANYSYPGPEPPVVGMITSWTGSGNRYDIDARQSQLRWRPFGAATTGLTEDDYNADGDVFTAIPFGEPLGIDPFAWVPEGDAPEFSLANELELTLHWADLHLVATHAGADCNLAVRVREAESIRDTFADDWSQTPIMPGDGGTSWTDTITGVGPSSTVHRVFFGPLGFNAVDGIRWILSAADVEDEIAPGIVGSSGSVANWARLTLAGTLHVSARVRWDVFNFSIQRVPPLHQAQRRGGIDSHAIHARAADSRQLRLIARGPL